MPRMRVTLRGLTATYDRTELAWMRKLWKRSEDEALFVHEAMARFDGRLK